MRAGLANFRKKWYIPSQQNKVIAISALNYPIKKSTPY